MSAVADAFRCLWIEDRPDEVGEVISALYDEDGWDIKLVGSREEMLAEIELGNRSWDLIILDGRMAAEHGSNPEDAGHNIFLDLRCGELGEWGRSVPIVLYSGIAEVLERISRVAWPDPAPIVITKNDEFDIILDRFVRTKAEILGRTAAANDDGAILFVGAGRIGLGVGIPLIMDGGTSGLILFNRYSSANASALRTAAVRAHQRDEHLLIVIPGREYRATVWFDGLGEEALLAGIRQSVRDKGVLIVLSDFDSTLQTIREHCSLWMCSVGGGLDQVISRLTAGFACPSTPMEVIALENDHAGVHTAAKKLREAGSTVAVYPAVVDRICSEIVLLSQGVQLIGGTEYEFCTLKTPTTQRHFGDHPVAQLVESTRALDFRHSQKALMVNLLHWIIAVVRANKVIGRVQTLAELDAQFMEITTDTQVDKRVYATFSRLLALKVVFDSDNKVLRELYPNLPRELIVNRVHEHGIRTISRATKTPDRISRIIKGSSSEAFRARYARNFDALMADIRNRKETYFAELKSFLSITDRTINQRMLMVEGAAQDVRRLLEQLESKPKASQH